MTSHIEPSEWRRILREEHLAVAVPRRIAQLAARGGPTHTDWWCVQEFSTAIVEEGDLLSHGNHKDRRRMIDGFVDCLAVLAFAPFGVHFGGMRWEATAPRFPAPRHRSERHRVVRAPHRRIRRWSRR